MRPAASEAGINEPQQSRCEVADIFRTYGPQYRAEHQLSPAKAKAMRDIEQCRTAALGGHLEQCDACQATRPVYNSCLMGSKKLWGVQTIGRAATPRKIKLIQR